MGFDGIIQRLISEGVIAIYHDYRSGLLHDWSGNARGGINAANVVFNKKRLQYNTIGGVVEVADDATLRGLTGCLIARFKPGQAGAGPIASKYLNPNYQFYWAYNGASLDFIDTGAPYPNLACPANITGTHAINFANGGTPVGYLNGILLGNYSTTWNSAAVATNLKIGNFGTVNASVGQGLEYFLWVTRALTATEHQELYQQLQSLTWPNSVYDKSKKVNYVDVNDSTLVININGPIKNGKILDSRGFSSLISIPGSSNVNTLFGPLAKSYPGVPAGYNVSGAYPSVNNQSFTACMMVSEIPISGAGIVVHSAQVAGGGACAWFIVYGAPPGPGWLLQCNLGATATHSYGSYSPNKPTFISIKIDHTVPVFGISLDGVPYSIGRAIGAYRAFGSGGLILGGRTNNDAVTYDGLLGNLSMYSELKTDAWVRSRWVKIAQAAQLKTGWGAKASIANESTAGNFVGGGSTPIEILSGTWKTSLQVVNGELHKVVECVVAGTVWLDRKFMNINDTEGSYGAWRLSYGHVKDAVNVAHIALTSTAKAAWDAAGNTGYVLRLSATLAGDRLLRYSGGGAANLVFTMPNSLAPTNQIQVTRRFDNLWQGYQTPNMVTDPQITPPWAPSTDGPNTDAAYTTSLGMSFSLNAGDWVSLGTVRGEYALTKFLGEFDPREV